jgi:hypothetical protein
MKQRKSLGLYPSIVQCLYALISCANVRIYGSIKCCIHKADQFELLGSWSFSIVRYSKEHNVCFRPQMRAGRQFGPLERAHLSHWATCKTGMNPVHTLHLRN